MQELEKFYKTFIQEVTTSQLANDEGDTQEQAFTRYVLDLLSEAGETENTAAAYDERYLGTPKQLKINGYALADNYETVDLFISIYNPEDHIHPVAKVDIDRAAKRLYNFFKLAVYNDYAQSIAESSEIFEFANTLGCYDDLKQNLVRVNAFILTDGEYKGEIPETKDVAGYKFFFRVIDINYLYQISAASRVPIEINFEEEGYKVPCLSVESKNEDYNAYVAIFPGIVLANLYERFGARLLEQNVRAFLQFSGKINKGIRNTIKKEPHMFLAFNNGLAVTADYIDIDEETNNIRRISNLQIVNGGQTTASIYHTYKKDKADISQIYVQAKISVVKKVDEYATIVARISRCANTQNKVNDADFTSNNEHLIRFEKLSRYFLTPVTDSCNHQTYWFFERARGQYKNLSVKEGFTKARKSAFEIKYPKSQVITKYDLAKFINSYCEIYDGKALVIGPHIVTRGNEKNFTRFINYNLPALRIMNSVYYEDTIAKAIIFKAADKIYGTKKSTNPIGEHKQVVVPYTIALLTILTNKQLDLYKIWKNQRISVQLTEVLYKLMKQVNAFILENSPSANYIEWAKKEECWEQVKTHSWDFSLDEIKYDLIQDNSQPRKAISISEYSSEEHDHDVELALSIPHPLWKKIAEWGKYSGCLNINQYNGALEIADRLRFKHKLSSLDKSRAVTIFNIVCEKIPELLLETDTINEELEAQMIVSSNSICQSSENSDIITVELIKKMVEWDRRRRILEDWKWKAMEKIASGQRQLDNRIAKAMFYNLQKLKRFGFKEEE